MQTEFKNLLNTFSGNIPGQNISPKKPTTQSCVWLVSFLSLVVLLYLFGLQTLYSTSYTLAGMTYFIKQIIWGVLGLGLAFTIFFLGYERIIPYATYLILGLIIMLLLPITIMRHAVKGAYRWISLGPIRIQPSEFAKVVLVLFAARWLNEITFWPKGFFNKNVLKKVLVPMLMLAFPIGLVLSGKDLGTTLLLATTLTLMFLMYCPIKVSLSIVAFLTPIIYSLRYQPVLDFLKEIGLLTPYRIARIVAYQNPELYADKEGYQLWLSQLALGSGGWDGLGMAQSRMKLMYLPEAHTDFILSITGEEMGFWFILMVILFYILLAFFGYMIAIFARTRLGMFIAFGMTTFIVFQSIVNIGVICGQFPTKGMPAPFISYGGSTLITCFTAVGFIASVAADAIRPQYADECWEWLMKLRDKFFPRKQQEKENAK